MALDFMAIASLGTYPTPGVTTTQRAAYATSYGLLGTLVASTTGQSWMKRMRRAIVTLLLGG